MAVTHDRFFLDNVGSRALHTHTHTHSHTQLSFMVASSSPRWARAQFAMAVHTLLCLQVAGWILELDRGAGIPFEGNYSEWLSAKDKRLKVS